MSKISEGNLLQPGIPGTISVMSRENTVHNPSLVQDIWEFDHDPDDQFIKKIIRDKEAKLRKQHSHQQLKNRLPLYPNDGSSFNADQYCYHSQLAMQVQKNQYGLADNKKPHKINPNKYRNSSKKSGDSRSRSNNSQTHHGLQKKQRKSKSNESKDSYEHIRNIENIVMSIPGYQETNLLDELEDFSDDQGPGSIQRNHKNLTKGPQSSYSLNRNLDIYSHKYISNFNFILSQLKQLLSWNRLYRVQAEIQQYRKAIMKLQIDCRKLKIGLRNSSSLGGIVHLRRKEYIAGKSEAQQRKSPRFREGEQKPEQAQRHNFAKPTWNSRSGQKIKTRKGKQQLQKEKSILQQIRTQRKKQQQLGTKQSLITNYYNALKNRLLLEAGSPQKLQSKDSDSTSIVIGPNSNILSKNNNFKGKNRQQTIIKSPNSYRSNEQINILLRKRKILLSSIQQSKTHYQQKISQLSEEITIIKKQCQLIENRIYKFKSKKNDNDEVNSRYVHSKPTEIYYNHHPHKNTRKVNELGKYKNINSSSKKIVFRSANKDEGSQMQNRFSNNSSSKTKGIGWKLNKVKSNKDFYSLSNVKQQIIDNEEINEGNKEGKYSNQQSQYFTDQKKMKSYNHK